MLEDDILQESIQLLDTISASDVERLINKLQNFRPARQQAVWLKESLHLGRRRGMTAPLEGNPYTTEQIAVIFVLNDIIKAGYFDLLQELRGNSSAGQVPSIDDVAEINIGENITRVSLAEPYINSIERQVLYMPFGRNIVQSDLIIH